MNHPSLEQLQHYVSMDFGIQQSHQQTTTHQSSLQQTQLPHFTLKWLQSFLDNRFQRVHLSENLTTYWKYCSSGVPQGSIIGPILFAMLINSYNVISSRSKEIIYADDLSIIQIVPTS